LAQVTEVMETSFARVNPETDCEPFYQEVLLGERFQFGENWKDFLRGFNEGRLKQAEDSLKRMLSVASLDGQSFLDIGSGSGLFSLAARRLGARVLSFDYDPDSVFCVSQLKRFHFGADPLWMIQRGSVLDRNYVQSLGQFDTVYSWGVLHHTGQMHEALNNAGLAVAPGGTLFIAIYNDQGWISSYWKTVKKLYNRGAFFRYAITLFHFPYLFCLRFVLRALTGRLKLERGMSLWHDMLDWLGGYPFEVSTPQEIVDFYAPRGFKLERAKACGRRHGCNEFVFRREAPQS
jgi:2-polyprenyl-6-hydroxyphenyl methylase/3-demethylubiquinone-9 3-methyltransferase